ncbi:MAG TPA: hypothetical protein VHR45_23870 [Thermoanaerobaculia bacterium]|nr:hypothetical protein [Thermoanaerobaculia bacterium]
MRGLKRDFMLLLLLLPVLLLPGMPASAHTAHRDREWSATKEGNVEKTLSFAGGTGARSLTVDNFEGAVTVTGRHARDGAEVHVVVHQSYRADSQEKLAVAEREVKLEVSQSGNHIELLMDGPFRCKCKDGGTDFHGWDRVGYEARFDFELQVPEDLDLVVRTVNGGDVKVRDVHGNLELANVNGGIETSGVAGAVNAHTVNGPVHVSFARNPSGSCQFHSVNGKLDVGFKSGLAADLNFKTLNGEVYSDFPYSYRPLPAGKAERRQGKFVYRSHGGFAVRVADGGPEMAFSTINGDILIRNQDL